MWGSATIAGRLTYGVICKLRLGWDGTCNDEVVNSLARKFLLELLDVTENLQPMPRAWVPVGYSFTKVLCPIDGGDGAFAAHGYVRSKLPPESCEQVVTTSDTVESESGKFCSRLAMARCKVSNLSVPDNEQASLLLGTRVVQHMLETVPEDPKDKLVWLSFLTLSSPV